MPASTRWIETSTRATPSRKPPELRLIPNSKAPGVSDDCPTNTRASHVHDAPKPADLRFSDIPRRAHPSTYPSRDLSDTSQAAPRYVPGRPVLLAQCATAWVWSRAHVAARRGSLLWLAKSLLSQGSFQRKTTPVSYLKLTLTSARCARQWTASCRRRWTRV